MPKLVSEVSGMGRKEDDINCSYLYIERGIKQQPWYLEVWETQDQCCEREAVAMYCGGWVSSPLPLPEDPNLHQSRGMEWQLMQERSGHWPVSKIAPAGPAGGRGPE
jgi:hypothetical protein